MRATVMYKAGDVRIEKVPDPKLIEPTDAIISVTRACICGSDLWPYKNMERNDAGRVMGHEAIGIVADVGRDVRSIAAISSSCHSPSRMARVSSVTKDCRLRACTVAFSAQR